MCIFGEVRLWILDIASWRKFGRVRAVEKVASKIPRYLIYVMGMFGCLCRNRYSIHTVRGA